MLCFTGRLRFASIDGVRIKLFLAASLLVVPLAGRALQVSTAANADPAAVGIERGILSFRNGEIAAAKLQFSVAVKANPRSADALTWRGISENKLMQYAEAARDFEQALRLAPDALPAHYNLALSLIRLGQHDRAIEHLQAVVKVQPGVLEPEYNLALLLESKNAIPEAIEHLEAAYKTQPNDVTVEQHLLIDLLRMGQLEEAKPILEKMGAVTSADTLEKVGMALVEAGQFSQAIQLLERARAQENPGIELNLLLARAYIGAQEDHKAIDLLKPAETYDKTGEAAYLLGAAYSDSGATEEARQSFERAVSANPRNGRALYHLGLIESTTAKQSPIGLHHLREAMRLEPGNAAYGIALGKLLLQQDDAQGAMTLLQGVTAKGPEAAERDLLLGIAQVTVSGPKQAEPTLLRAVEEHPSLALSHNLLGFCYFQLGELAKAALSYKQASDLSPDSRVFAHDAAVAFELFNDVYKAMLYAARAAALPGAKGEDHYLVAKLLAKAGKKDDAINELNKAIALDPDLEQPYYLLARTYMQTGDSATATELIARLKELKRKHEKAYAEARIKERPISSSILLQGAPMSSQETGTN